MIRNTSKEKEYFFNQMRMTDEQLEKLWEFFQQNVVVEEERTVVTAKRFIIEYSFSSIDATKTAKFQDKSLWIDEEDYNP